MKTKSFSVAHTHSPLEKWTETEAKHHQATARSLFKHSYDHADADPDNCGGCALVMGDDEGPNYAGWARVYVESGRKIPFRWKQAFEMEQYSPNAHYAAALAKSLATFWPSWLRSMSAIEKAMANVIKDLGLPVEHVASLRMECVQDAHNSLRDLETLLNREARERAVLEAAVCEALTWLEAKAPYRAYVALEMALATINAGRKQ